MQGFIEEILQQCRDVMAKHDQYSIDEYAKIGTYRGLEMEMIEVKVVAYQKLMLVIDRLCIEAILFTFCFLQAMAISKFEEWLQNKQNSFIEFRFKAALRTVRRRHILFQVFLRLQSPIFEEQS